MLKNERLEGRALACIIACVPVHSPGRGRRTASAGKSCSTQEAGQADPRKDIKRGGQREDGGTTEIDHITSILWDIVQGTPGAALLGPRTVQARTQFVPGCGGGRGGRRAGTVHFFFPFCHSSYPPTHPRWLSQSRKQNEEPLAFAGAKPPLLSLGRSPAGQLGQGQAVVQSRAGGTEEERIHWASGQGCCGHSAPPHRPRG